MLAARSVLSLLAMPVFIFCSNGASGQAYPGKTIRILAAEAGGGTDVTARLIAPLLGARLGQQVIIDNRIAAVAVEVAAKSPPDGYSLLITGPITWLLPLMRDNVPWDPVRDLSPLMLVSRSPSVLATHPSLPVKSVKELIALAKARPGELNIARGASGGPPDIAAQLFKFMSKANIVLVPYKGTGSAIIGLISGEVQMMFVSPTSVVHHMKSGKMKALAVTSPEPSALAPGLPTVAAAGLPGYESETKVGLFAPARTPTAIINRLSEELVAVLNGAEVREKLFSTGVGVAASSPDEFAVAMKAEMARLGKVIKEAGIRAQ